MGRQRSRGRAVSEISARQPAWSPPDTRGIRVPERTLHLLRDLVQSYTGMWYDEHRLDYLRDRLSALAIDRGFDSLLDYYYLLKYDSNADQEWVRAIDALSVQETYFWREFDQFRALADRILPRLAALGRTHVRIWSLPCATGEEPLSIAMALLEGGWFSRMAIELHAADASEAALQRARAGRYGERAFRQLPHDVRTRYFDPVDGSQQWVVKAELHKRVSSWNRMNVVHSDELAAVRGADVVFCRNLFIYFDQATIRRVVGELGTLMALPAFLCVGAAESLLRLGTEFELQELGGAYVYVKS
jgi:chemotaxis protein methyltransferase CheR